MNVRDAEEGDAPDVDTLAAGVDNAARMAAAEQARRAREAEARAQRDSALAAERDRVQREELRRAREQLERFRMQQAAGETARFQPLVSGNADAAALVEAFELQRITLEQDALLAPLVVSSARALSGGRSHTLEQHPPQVPLPPLTVVSGPAAGAQPPGAVAPARPPFAAPAPPAPPPALPPLAPPPFARQPAAPPPATPGFTGGAGGSADVIAPVAGPGGAGGTGGSVSGVLGAPIGRPGRGEPGTFDTGPRADGGGAGETNVVVTPNDGLDYRLYEGMLLPAVLQTQIQGDFSGPVSAQVTRAVYSRDRQRILVPRGTVVLGTAQGTSGPFQERLAVGFHRMIFPDGRWVSLDGENSLWGLSGLGESSLRDQVNRHYVQAFGSAAAIGLLAALSQGGGGVQGGGFGLQDALSQNAAQVALQLMQRFLNRRPTVTIRAGHRLVIRMMTDIIIPRDAAHNLD